MLSYATCWLQLPTVALWNVWQLSEACYGAYSLIVSPLQVRRELAAVLLFESHAKAGTVCESYFFCHFGNTLFVPPVPHMAILCSHRLTGVTIVSWKWYAFLCLPLAVSQPTPTIVKRNNALFCEIREESCQWYCSFFSLFKVGVFLLKGS